MQAQGYRLSPQQKRIWLLQHESSAYKAQRAILLEGPLDIDALKRALQSIIDRHEILRTRFNLLPGMRVPLQVVDDEGELTLDELDLRNSDLKEQQERIDGLFAQLLTARLDLEQGAIFKCTLIGLEHNRHVLMISLPSLCADLRSLNNLTLEVARQYESALKGEERVEEVMQYALFAQWQNALLEDEADQEGRNHWKKQSLGTALSAPLPLAGDSVAEFRMESHDIGLDPAMVGELQKSALSLQASVPALLLACWSVTLWRLSGEATRKFGYVCDGRPYDILRGSVGVFARSVPVSCRCEADYRFNEVLKSVTESVSEANEWQEYFKWEASADETAGLEEDSFFSAGFEFAECESPGRSGELRISVLREYSCVDRFHIKLNCKTEGDSLIARLDFDSGAYEAESVRRLAGYFKSVLKSVTANPHSRIGDLAVLKEAERQQLLREFNDTASAYPKDRCLHALFEEQTESVPDRVAVIFEDLHLTFAEVNNRANHLAQSLMDHGVAPEEPVALCVNPSAEMIVGLLGVLKAGCAYLPMDADAPEKRLSGQIANTKARLMITQSDIRADFCDAKLDRIYLDRALPVEHKRACDLPVTARPQWLAYIIHTSGSTGLPKGVAITHENLANYTFSICDRLNLRAGLSFATVSSIAADLGNTAIFPSLVTGGCLHVLSREVVTSVDLLGQYIASRSIDVLKIVPSHLNAMLVSNYTASVLPLTWLIVGGEAFSPELARRVALLGGTCKLANHYGPTETTIGSTVFQVALKDYRDPKEQPTLPIGRPVANSHAYILDPMLMPVPMGITGEMYIGGAGVARGYVNQPDSTADRFIPDPYVGGADSRAYRTGDLARHLADGTIEFVGRADHQVKIRGFRIEVKEIEGVLSEHPSVRSAIVTARDEIGGDRRLVAYVVANQREPASQSELRAYLRSRLPDYMIPSIFVPLNTLPLTSSGKPDRRALPAPDQTRPELESTFVAPATPVEQSLARIWAELLGMKQVGSRDNFFDLGGHSLLATQVISRLRELFNVEIYLRHLFEAPTVAGLAKTIEVFQLMKQQRQQFPQNLDAQVRVEGEL